MGRNLDAVARASATSTTIRGSRSQRVRTPSELKRIVEAQRKGLPFLVWRDSTGKESVLALDGLKRATVGRSRLCDVVLIHDEEVSRTHAELEFIGGGWTVADDGLSRNGTYVNSHRISQRKRLVDGDQLRFGVTTVEYYCASETTTAITAVHVGLPAIDRVTETQRRILIALCRPYATNSAYAMPASNGQIASEVFLGLDAVKNHLRLLFQRFELTSLPQNEKRARLAELAFEAGLVSARDF